jgi:hypothetical protein
VEARHLRVQVARGAQNIARGQRDGEIPEDIDPGIARHWSSAAPAGAGRGDRAPASGHTRAILASSSGG